MNDEQNAVVFAGIFKQTIQNILSRVKAWVSSCPDPYTPLLISAINTKSKEKLNQKGYDILDYYFDQVNFCVWPRFTEIYDHLILPFSHPNYQQVLALETELGLEIYYGPVVTFLRGLFVCSQQTMDNQMINHRVSKLLDLLIKFTENLSELERTMKDKKISIIKRMNVIYKETQSRNSLSEQDSHSLEKVAAASPRKSRPTSSLSSTSCSRSTTPVWSISRRRAKMRTRTPTPTTCRSSRTSAKSSARPGTRASTVCVQSASRK